MQEIIYILTNEAMPDLVKIGYTNNSLEERLKQLDRTNLPLPFEVYYACEVENAHKDEKWLHSIQKNISFAKTVDKPLAIQLVNIDNITA
jgi:hypothetical protein